MCPRAARREHWCQDERVELEISAGGGGAGDHGADAALSWLSAAEIDPRVTELRPDYAAVIIVAGQLRPGPPDERTGALLRDAAEFAVKALGGGPPEAIPEVAAWREAYRAFGAKPQRTRPSVEALLRRAGDGLPRIDRITDIYNAISVRHLLPVGGEDLASYRGPARLVRAGGGEPFDTVSGGDPVTEHPEPGEVVWRDDVGVTCRRWNWRQCVRTRITQSTTSAVFILDGLGALGQAGLMAAAADLTGQLAALHEGAWAAQRLLPATVPSGR